MLGLAVASLAFLGEPLQARGFKWSERALFFKEPGSVPFLSNHDFKHKYSVVSQIKGGPIRYPLHKVISVKGIV